MWWSIQRKKQSLVLWRFVTLCCSEAGNAGLQQPAQLPQLPSRLLCRHPSAGELTTEMKGEVLTSQFVTNTMPGSQNSLGRSEIIDLFLHGNHRTNPRVCTPVCVWKWKGPCNTCPPRNPDHLHVEWNSFLNYFLMNKMYFFPNPKETPSWNS